MQADKQGLSRGMLVFLDDSEAESGEFGFVGTSLFAALAQSAGPIIASRSLLVHLFNDRAFWDSTLLIEDGVNRLNRDELAAEFNRIVTEERRGLFSKKPMSREEKGVLRRILGILGFNSQKWVIKQVNNLLCLLIPHTFLEICGVHYSNVEAYTPESKDLSTIELQLGLKVNHMSSDVSFEKISNLPDYANYFVKALPSIFCTRSDYKDKQAGPIPSWSFYVIGHGEYRESVVALLFKQFNRFLHFLKYSINTRLLLYDSCYAAGQNTELIYKNDISKLQQAYSFPIITNALTDAVVFCQNYLEVKDGSLHLLSGTNFARFLKSVTVSDIIDYKTLVLSTQDDYKTVFSKTRPAELFDGFLHQIKLPGLEWFSVLKDRPNIVSIGSVLSRTRERPLKIGSDVELVLLYTQNAIPFDLFFDECPAIISMVPGEAHHLLSRISSARYGVIYLINMFMRLSSLEGTKTFYINEIKGRNSVVKNVIIKCGNWGGVAYYHENGTDWVYKRGKFESNRKNKEDERYDQWLEERNSILIFEPKPEGMLSVPSISSEAVEDIKKTIESKKDLVAIRLASTR